MAEKSIKKIPEISIGMPIYNGEKFLNSRLNSILTQTFENFELIISDNASTDNTSKICKEFMKKDKRIKFIQQNENKGVTWNLNFVLKESKAEFFMWAAADDIISKDFLEKNYEILKNNKNYVASISKINPIVNIERIEEKDFLSNFKDELRDKSRPRSIFTIKGNFDEKVRLYLRKSSCQVIYSLFRKRELSTYFHESFIGNDWTVFLNILKYGDLNVLDEVLMLENQSGITGKGIVSALDHYETNLFSKICPWYPLTKWCFKNLGKKIFLKNLDYFIQLNIEGGVSLAIDYLRKSRK